jgi:hypothetical protein
MYTKQKDAVRSKIWQSGRKLNTLDVPTGGDMIWETDIKLERTFAWFNMTPFGLPVVPEV